MIYKQTSLCKNLQNIERNKTVLCIVLYVSAAEEEKFTSKMKIS